MKLLNSASVNKGSEIRYTFDTGHVLSVYATGAKYITLGNRSAFYTHRTNIYKKMLLAIKQF
jgi:hypothetical protein